MAPRLGSAQTSPDAKFYSTLAGESTPDQVEHTGKAGQGVGAPFEDRCPGGILVGFDVWYGNLTYGPHTVVDGVCPIFQTATGIVRGKKHGSTRGEPTAVIQAKEGYAVATIEARGGDRLDGFKLVFWKINVFDASLDAEGSYESSWVGGNGGGRPLSVNSDGRPVVGIFGANGFEIDYLGLVCPRSR